MQVPAVRLLHKEVRGGAWAQIGSLGAASQTRSSSSTCERQRAWKPDGFKLSPQLLGRGLPLMEREIRVKEPVAGGSNSWNSAGGA